MKQRAGFVSNSSSSSYIVFGFLTEEYIHLEGKPLYDFVKQFTWEEILSTVNSYTNKDELKKSFETPFKELEDMDDFKTILYDLEYRGLGESDNHVFGKYICNDNYCINEIDFDRLAVMKKEAEEKLMILHEYYTFGEIKTYFAGPFPS